MRRRSRLIGAVVLAVLPAVVAGPAVAASGAGFGVRVVPDARAGTGPYFRLTLPAGGSTTQRVEVENRSGRPLRFVVSAVDGLTGTTSGAVYASRGVPVREAGRWVLPAARGLTLRPHGRARVALVVRLPAGTPPGQYLAGLAVEDRRPRVSSTRGFRVRTVVRAVVGVLVQIPGRARFVPRLGGLGIRELGGPRVASVQVRLGNAGRRLGRPVLKVVLRGPRGYRRTVVRRLDTILAGDTITYPVAWPDGLAAGSYDVTATLRHGAAVARRHARVQLGTTLRGLRAEVPPAASPRAGGPAPWQFLVVLVTGIAGGIAVRRRPHERSAA